MKYDLIQLIFISTVGLQLDKASEERVTNYMKEREEYFSWVKKYPALFVNPPGAGFHILLDDVDIQEVEKQAAQLLEAKGMPTQWAQVGVAHQDQYITLLRDAVRFPNGRLGTYIRTVGDGTPGVIVFPVYQRHILLIRHFRHATRTWHLEIPRGFGEKGLSSEENARRELEEEIGATISRLISLGHVYPDAGATSGHNDFFYAEVTCYGNVDTNEAITELQRVSVEEFERMIRENEINDGFTLAAYGLVKTRGLL